MPVRVHLVHGSGEQDLKGPRKQTGCRVPTESCNTFRSSPSPPSLLLAPRRPKCHYAGTGYTLYAHVIKRAGGREVGSRVRQRGGERGASRGGQTPGHCDANVSNRPSQPTICPFVRDERQSRVATR